MPDGALRVLVVDDTAHMRLLVQSVLERAGHAVDCADGGEEALRLFARRDYDAVVMDLQMPGLDGPETARRMREDERLRGRPRAPLLALTADAAPDALTACREAGFDAHLPKPFERPQLLDAVARLRGGCVAPAADALDPELADLAPQFLRQLAADLAGLATAARGGDLGAVAAGAHRVVGAGGSFGFHSLSALARELEAAARRDDAAAAGDALARLTARAAELAEEHG
ncbi:MAG: response regulator [Elusimicrobiota bacterium]|nr:response regulator [Elusimicrobiota bacterium]